MSKAARPGAFAASGRDGAAAIRQRVDATLGWGSASRRRSRPRVPEPAAASASLRLALKSSIRGVPQASMMTAPSCGQRSASSAARRTSAARRPRTRMSVAGSRPSVASPGACRWPLSVSPRLCRIQTTGRRSAARMARAAAKPVTAPASAGSPPNISCRAPRSRPPPRAASTDAAPSPSRFRDGPSEAGSRAASWAFNCFRVACMALLHIHHVHDLF